MIKHYLDYIAIERKYSDKTVRAYRDDIYEFCAFVGLKPENFSPDKVCEEDVREWMMHMMESQHLSPRSVKRKLSSLHGLYRFLLRLNLASKDITQRIVSPKTDKPLPVFFKPAEMQRVTAEDDAADDFNSIRDCLIIEMLYQTGMRRAEMIGLTDADVDTNNARIRVFGKRKKERIVPIGDKLIKQIKRYLEARNEVGECGTFFVREKKNGTVVPLNAQTLYNIVCARMGEVSTLQKHSPHVLRHTFATTMLNNGADIRTIQSLLGHSSLAATQVYTHTTFEQIKQTYNHAHPRAIKRKDTP
ncbi:MAG: tyrosine-type recombinase/integrase [Paludibacteraceae bacterium]|nr:tyrosine-type recombinase/integrase [Paludibacteraceae bacterium]